MADLKFVCADDFWPRQVAIGNPSGSSLVVFGAQAFLELHPDWEPVRLAVRNAFIEIK